MAESTANKTYGYQLTELATTFNTLSEDKILKTALLLGDGYVLRPTATSGVYSASACSDVSSVTRSARFGNKTLYHANTLANSTTFTNQTNQNNMYSMKLVYLH